jgi:hypothetical protein
MSENFKEIEKAVTVRDHVILALGLNFTPTDPLSHVRHESGMKIVDEVMGILEKAVWLERNKALRESYNVIKFSGLDENPKKQATLGRIWEKIKQAEDERFSKGCYHDWCSSCHGSGFNATNGKPCVHAISCPCPKCSPTY